MTSNDGIRSRLLGRLLHLRTALILAAMAIILCGCAPSAAVKKEPDITNLKLEDFSELKVPGEGSSALFNIVSYDVDIEKFAIVRIAAEQMQSLLPKGDRGERIRADGMYAAMLRKNQQAVLSELLVESNARVIKTTSLLFYDATPEDFWLKNTNDHGSIQYKDPEGNSHLLEMDDGFLGISFSITFERLVFGVPLTISPQFQQKNSLPESYLKRLNNYSKNGRMILSDLSFTAPMNIGDFLVICPDMLPLDNQTFSSYAFRGEKDSTFKIYSIYCKSLTGI